MTAHDEDRRLTLIGVLVALAMVVAVVLIATNPFAKDPADRIRIVLDVPYVGQGVAAGTPLIMHGVEVGEITGVSVMPGGNVELGASVQIAPIADVTDTLSVDFRPANYFGVTGINLIPGSGGSPLTDGAQINVTPVGNFTLPTMLSQLGEITDGVITPQLVNVINRATRYTDGLNPLFETMLIGAKTLARVQTVSTEQLLQNATGISVAFPSFVDGATVAGDAYNTEFVTWNVSGKDALPGQAYVAEPGMEITDEIWQSRARATLDVMSGSFFGALGRVLSSHSGDLLPAVNLVQTITDVIPGLVTPVGVSDMLVELRTRLQNLYGGTPEQRALQVHLVLDKVPGVQAPVNAMGGP
ncbi:MAG: Mammalian cell entry related domain protein [Mycolicibacterium sp.]|jgi:hypothetical protein|uniref:Mammalian cell entry related domain protein n=1 Tax=Mycolicibacterium insubricum TaxID=444597 RepID=A0A1X0D6J5_9MYCO|nr:Mammalian cell entry related domain protein [Mycolicibacterium insubricum]MCB9440290.1 Mammalian cell entry related domain protein [Mycolicibacterium sp.]MCV7081564.1 Mammalian cell entry related domain protein [Mycolicibacterium insubricum]ORA68021.1 Mammalian cell entry related domain protein [Mycolicibacterium insubricum]